MTEPKKIPSKGCYVFLSDLADHGEFQKKSP